MQRKEGPVRFVAEAQSRMITGSPDYSSLTFVQRCFIQFHLAHWDNLTPITAFSRKSSQSSSFGASYSSAAELNIGFTGPRGVGEEVSPLILRVYDMIFLDYNIWMSRIKYTPSHQNCAKTNPLFGIRTPKFQSEQPQYGCNILFTSKCHHETSWLV